MQTNQQSFSSRLSQNSIKSFQNLSYYDKFQNIIQTSETLDHQIYVNCISKNQAVMFCINQNCKQNSAFICQKSKCSCRKNHSLCQKAFIDQAMEAISLKIHKTQQIKQDMKNVIQHTISQLRRFQQYLEQKIEYTMKYIQLSEIQKQFYFLNTSITNKDNFNFKGQDLYKLWSLITFKPETDKGVYAQTKKVLQKLQKSILSSYQDSVIQIDCVVTKFKQNINEFQEKNLKQHRQQRLSKYKEDVQKELTQLHKIQANYAAEELSKKYQAQLKQKDLKFHTILNQKMAKCKTQTINEINIKSPILGDAQNSFRLANFFTKKIKKINLVFKASEFGFSISKFYDAWGSSHNLIFVVRTNKDKILGGFTPVSFAPSPNLVNNQYGADASGLSFLFSLSENQKFELKNNNYAIQRYPSKSYIIFGNHEFQLYSHSNTNNNNCFTLLNSYYNTSRFNGNSKDSHLRINGNEDQHFTTKEWEVYQVEFA